jgi:acyl-CoA dehydrogenase
MSISCHLQRGGGEVDKLDISDELKMLKKMIDTFIKKQVLPAETAIGRLDKIPDNLQYELQGRAQKIGMWMLGVKSEWGGVGLGIEERTVLMEEASKHRYGLYHPACGAFGRDLPSILEKGGEHLYSSYIEAAVKSGKGCFAAIFEPDESNHLNNLKCTARREGDSWILDGMKSYVKDADDAEFGLILVRTQDTHTLFLIDKEDQGVTLDNVSLMDAQTSWKLKLDHVVLPDTRRIGQIGEGIALTETWLDESKILLAARCLGVAAKALQMGAEYARMRVTRGKPLAQFPAIRTMLAVSAADLKAARLVTRDAAARWNDRTADPAAPSMAKWMAAAAASRIVDRVIQIHGGAGLTDELPLQRWYKELRIARADLGNTESLHEKIASSLIDV